MPFWWGRWLSGHAIASNSRAWMYLMMMMMVTRTFQIWILVLFSPYFPNYVTNILSWAWKVSTLETTAIFSLFGSHIHIPQWWGHQQTGAIVLAQSLIKIMCTLFIFFCISPKEFSAYRIKKIVALEMEYTTLGSSRMHFQKRISRRG